MPTAQIKGITKTSLKEAQLLKEKNETLKDNLLELQMEFDHYKRIKQEQILELQDKVEKLDEIEKELEKYQNMDDLQSELTKKNNQIDQLQLELQDANYLYQQQEKLNNQKDLESRELESQIDELKQQMEN